MPKSDEENYTTPAEQVLHISGDGKAKKLRKKGILKKKKTPKKPKKKKSPKKKKVRVVEGEQIKDATGKVMTKEQIDKIIARRLAGESVWEIARDTKLSTQKIYRILRGVSIPRKERDAYGPTGAVGRRGRRYKTPAQSAFVESLHSLAKQVDRKGAPVVGAQRSEATTAQNITRTAQEAYKGVVAPEAIRPTRLPTESISSYMASMPMQYQDILKRLLDQSAAGDTEAKKLLEKAQKEMDKRKTDKGKTNAIAKIVRKEMQAEKQREWEIEDITEGLLQQQQEPTAQIEFEARTPQTDLLQTDLPQTPTRTTLSTEMARRAKTLVGLRYKPKKELLEEGALINPTLLPLIYLAEKVISQAERHGEDYVLAKYSPYELETIKYAIETAGTTFFKDRIEALLRRSRLPTQPRASFQVSAEELLPALVDLPQEAHPSPTAETESVASTARGPYRPKLKVGTIPWYQREIADLEQKKRTKLRQPAAIRRADEQIENYRNAIRQLQAQNVPFTEASFEVEGTPVVPPKDMPTQPEEVEEFLPDVPEFIFQEEELPPFEPLGSGFKLQRTAPDYVQAFIDQHRNWSVVKIQVGRTALEKALTKAINVAMAGQLRKRLDKLHIDDLFHTFLIITIKLANKTTEFILEKNERIYLFPKAQEPEAKKIELMNVPMAYPILLGTFFLNGEKAGGKEHYVYHPINANCQWFVRNMLSGNGLLTRELDKFIMQPIKNLIPKWMQKVGSFATSTQNLITKAFLEPSAEDVKGKGSNGIYRRGGEDGDQTTPQPTQDIEWAGEDQLHELRRLIAYAKDQLSGDKSILFQKAQKRAIEYGQRQALEERPSMTEAEYKALVAKSEGKLAETKKKVEEKATEEEEPKGNGYKLKRWGYGRDYSFY
jgi:hypothetical protein